MCRLAEESVKSSLIKRMFMEAVEQGADYTDGDAYNALMTKVYAHALQELTGVRA